MSGPAVFDVTEMELLLDDGGVEVRRADAGEGMSLLWVKVPQGHDFGPALKGLPHDMCPCEHWGMVTEGQMDITTHDGQSLSLSAGQAFHLLPGHAPSFPEACSWFEFSPKDQANQLLSHMGFEV